MAMNEVRNVEQSTTNTGENPSRSGTWWRLPLLLAVVLAAIVASRSMQQQVRGPDSEIAALPQAADATGQSVSLVIQFGEGRERKIDAVAWHPGMTVDELMTAASRLPSGPTYTVGGDHEMMLLWGIDGVLNEKGGGRSWTYKVNDVPADRSLAVYELRPGDRVLWTFGPQE